MSPNAICTSAHSSLPRSSHMAHPKYKELRRVGPFMYHIHVSQKVKRICFVLVLIVSEESEEEGEKGEET